MKENNSYFTDSVKMDKIIFAVLILILVALIGLTLSNTLGRAAEPSGNEAQTLEVNYEIDFINHVVKAGESVSYIAEIYIGDYPGSFSDYQSLICRNNGIRNPNRIQVGDIISVPIYTRVVTD